MNLTNYSKLDARKFLKDKNKSLSGSYYPTLQKQIIEEISNCKTIIAYRADQYEFSLDFLLEDTISNTFKLYFPRVIPTQNKKLDFVYPQSWEIGAYKIPSPVGIETIEPIDADKILVPALGFNSKGFRLGRGGGFYDFSLQRVPKEKLIGIALSKECIISFIEELHDIQVGKVLFP